MWWPFSVNLCHKPCTESDFEIVTVIHVTFLPGLESDTEEIVRGVDIVTLVAGGWFGGGGGCGVGRGGVVACCEVRSRQERITVIWYPHAISKLVGG
jgi:hypothetical protein